MKEKLFVDIDIKNELQDTDWVKVGNRYIKHVYFVPSDGSPYHQITVIYPEL